MDAASVPSLYIPPLGQGVSTFPYLTSSRAGRGKRWERSAERCAHHTQHSHGLSAEDTGGNEGQGFCPLPTPNESSSCDRSGMRGADGSVTARDGR